MRIKQIRKVEGSFWIGMGVLICLLAWKSKIGFFREPGPGFVAFISGIFVSMIGLVMGLSELLSKISLRSSTDLNQTFSIASWPRLIYTMVLLLSYALLLNTLGYILTTFLVMWGLFYDREKSRWVSSGLASLISVGVTYLVFQVWLRCQFPRGIFPWW
jgi:hypothetical protein